MTCGIYSITHKETGKTYIGQSTNIEKRFKQHINQKNMKTSYIDRSINRYGASSFEFNILYECNESELNLEEIKFINLYGTYVDGYNLTRGGEIPPSKHPEIAKRIGKANRGKKVPFKRKVDYSKSHNKTGFFRVSKFPCEKCQNGFTWIYRYYEDGKEHSFYNVDLMELKEKVLARGLEWKIVDLEKALGTLNDVSQDNKRVVGESGVRYVTKDACNSMALGYRWRYSDRKNGRYVSSGSLRLLREKVLLNGWEWIVLDETKLQTFIID